MTTKLAKEISRLTTAEKVLLAEELWNEVAASDDGLDVPEHHQKELERRLAESLAHPEADLPWAEFQKRFAARL